MYMHMHFDHSSVLYYRGCCDGSMRVDAFGF